MSIDKTKPVVFEKQLNNLLTTSHNDAGTFSADTAHDNISCTLAGGDTHDNNIMSKTEYETGKNIVSHANALFQGIPDPPELGNLPENNTCYILDYYTGSTLKGVNQLLDSASTPKITNFIASMIIKFHTPHGGAAAPDYKTVTGVLKGESDLVYMFTLYNSLLNKTIITNAIAHRLDFSAYSNYDILLFIHVYKEVLGINPLITPTFITNLNIFLKKKDTTDATKNKKIQYNKFRIVNIIVLNFIWQNVLNYCETLLNPKHNNNRDVLSISLLRNICFCSFLNKKGEEISFAQYTTGYVNKNAPLTNFNNLLNTLDLSIDDDVSKFIDEVATYTYEKYDSVANKIIRGSLPTNGNTYTFITSQRFSASTILSLIKTPHITNRGEGKTAKNKVEEQSMKKGINELYAKHPLKTTINDNIQIYLCQILKFQGDSSHLVMAYLINKAYETHCKPLTYFYLKDDFDYGVKTDKGLPSINITILTGERPLTCRSILEKVSVQSSTNFAKLNIAKSFNYITHISNPCIAIQSSLINFINLLEYVIDMDTSVDPIVVKPYTLTDATINISLGKIHEYIYDAYEKIKSNAHYIAGSINFKPAGLSPPTPPAEYPNKNNSFYSFVKGLLDYIKITEENNCTIIINNSYATTLILNSDIVELSYETIQGLLNSYQLYIKYLSFLKKNIENTETLINFIDNTALSDKKKLITLMSTIYSKESEFTIYYNFLNDSCVIFDFKANKLRNEHNYTYFHGSTIHTNATKPPPPPRVLTPALLTTESSNIIIFIKTHISLIIPFLNALINTFYKNTSKNNLYMIVDKGGEKWKPDPDSKIVEHILLPYLSDETKTDFMEQFEYFLINLMKTIITSRTDMNNDKKICASTICNILNTIHTHISPSMKNKSIEDKYILSEKLVSIMKIYKNLYEIDNILKIVSTKKPNITKTIKLSTFLDYIEIINTDLKQINILISDITLTPPLTKPPPKTHTKDDTIGESFFDNIGKKTKTNLLFKSDYTSSDDNYKLDMITILEYIKFVYLAIVDNIDTNYNKLITNQSDYIVSKTTDILIHELETNFNAAVAKSVSSSPSPLTDKDNIIKYVLRLTRVVNFNKKDSTMGDIGQIIINMVNAFNTTIKYIDLNGTEQTIPLKDRMLEMPELVGGSIKNITKKYIKHQKNKTLKGGSTIVENQKYIDSYNNFYKQYLINNTISSSSINIITNVININNIIEDSIDKEIEHIAKYINDTPQNTNMISSILTHIYLHINYLPINKNSLVFSQHNKDTFIKTITQYKAKLDSTDNRIFNSFEKYNKSNMQSTKTDQGTAERLKMKDEMNIIIKKINDSDFVDKLYYISLLTRDLFFYTTKDNKKITTIKMDNNAYMLWHEIISQNKYDKLEDYISKHSLFFSSVDYNYFLENSYDNATYDLTNFNQEYIYKKIAKYTDEKGKDPLSIELYDSKITKKQIANYKTNVKEYCIYGLIKTYTIVDFMLAIVKYYTNMSTIMNEIDDEPLNSETLFDSYYMYFKSLNLY